MKWICKVCGYVHEGTEPPAICPVCKAGRERFEKLPDAWEQADEHTVGVAQGMDSRLVEGLRSRFTAQCRDAGIVLAIARAADREGFPEIAGACQRIAGEQAGQAARLAELLGDELSAGTGENLQKQLDFEQRAAQDRQELAALAKELKYDVIQESLQEMARDAARHGRAFEGMLRRYFNR